MKPWSKMLNADVNGASLDAAWDGIRARRGRSRWSRRARVAGPALLAFAVLLLAVTGWRPSWLGASKLDIAMVTVPAGQPIALAGGAPLPEEWHAGTLHVVSFDDGSHIELGASAKLHTKNDDPARVQLGLETGTATFDVKPGGPRTWSIEAGAVTVRVLGTRFSVQRDATTVDVVVERGKVLVESALLPGGSRVLTAGQSVAVGPTAKAAAAPAPLPPAPHAPVPAPVPAPAHVSLSAPTPISAPAPADRMARADAARRQGNPREAVVLLSSVVARGEPSAALAAFTLGKIHLDDLADPLAGATWFERAIARGLPAGLDEEAHARVVESYSRAGRSREATLAADRYNSKFPQGRHLSRVRGWARE